MNDPRPVLALDLDNTLTWFTRPYLWWTTARGVPHEEIWDPNLIDEFQRGDGLMLCKPTPYSQMAVGELSKIVRPVIVTARNADIEDATRVLVARYFSPYINPDDIVLVGHDNGTPVVSKLEAILDRGLDPIGIVDDLYSTAKGYADTGRHGFVINIAGKAAAEHEHLTIYPEHKEAWNHIPHGVKQLIAQRTLHPAKTYV